MFNVGPFSFMLAVALGVAVIARLCYLIEENEPTPNEPYRNRERGNRRRRSYDRGCPKCGEPLRRNSDPFDFEDESACPRCSLNLGTSVSGQIEVCVICQEGVKRFSVRRKTLSCGHSFHHQCITLWVRERNNCPICRKTVQKND